MKRSCNKTSIEYYLKASNTAGVRISRILNGVSRGLFPGVNSTHDPNGENTTSSNDKIRSLVQ